MQLLRFTDSLSGRLILASMLLLPVFVLSGGVALDRSFAQSQAVAEQESLRTQVYLLLGAAEIFDGALWLPDALQEPRFNQPDSGLYARILDGNLTVWQSPSALATTLPPANDLPLVTGQEYYESLALNGQATKLFSFDVAWDTAQGREKNFRFEVFHEQTAQIAERQSYRRQLWRWLGSLTLLLIVVQYTIQRWGLRPLQSLAQDLQKLHSGENLTLSENYPAEIKPVISNLNQVLVAEREQRDRYRHTLADLAHSLKTPLAVIRSHLESDSLPVELLHDQVGRMDDIIRHQLQRSVSQTSTFAGQAVGVQAVVERLLKALQKVYADKQIQFDCQLPADSRFWGDEGDLMEILGNLLDNACKYCHQRVAVSAGSDELLWLEIGDDGPGIPEQLRQVVLTRGARADTAQVGQGIGLAVVVDILSSYRGSLQISQSALGGAQVRIELPLRQP
ncbi:ATP-binding protein [Halioxenophilus sp. WMMB6]|uniref:ATP-binding protein n=1 Tax=Halioxenophilus sp. WMMB6 TaxID=3073815 RepID=UPI00295E835D|nr:ATP-binding protein [Halioxenophilus sp. WMMB6]